MTLKPFMNFFGSKYRAAPKYPPPRFPLIVEPFAGSAGYALRYHERDVVLIEANPVITAVWNYLIHVKESEVLSLPLLRAGDLVSDLPICQEAKWLIGMNINAGADSPRDQLSAFTIAYRPPWPHALCDERCRHHDETYKFRLPNHGIFENFWGEKRRARIARQIGAIRHWTAIEGDYSLAPNGRVTWFIDPPYQAAGHAYTHHDIDRVALAAWCRSRDGQVIVCEALGADWLPFEFLGDMKSTPGSKRRGKVSEVIWTKEMKCDGLKTEILTSS